MKAIAYMRVSTKIGQTIENQRLVIQQWCLAHETEIEDILWLEESESTRKQRPIQQRAFDLLLNGEYQTLICVALDRWGRSTIELVDTLNKLIASGTRIVFIRNGLDLKETSYDATAKMYIQMLSAFAEYEREKIRERILDGQKRARQEGKKLGRTFGAKDKKPRRRSGYWLRWVREREKQKEQKHKKSWEDKLTAVNNTKKEKSK